MRKIYLLFLFAAFTINLSQGQSNNIFNYRDDGIYVFNSDSERVRAVEFSYTVYNIPYTRFNIVANIDSSTFDIIEIDSVYHTIASSYTIVGNYLSIQIIPFSIRYTDSTPLIKVFPSFSLNNKHMPFIPSVFTISFIYRFLVIISLLLFLYFIFLSFRVLSNRIVFLLWSFSSLCLFITSIPLAYGLGIFPKYIQDLLFVLLYASITFSLLYSFSNAPFSYSVAFLISYLTVSTPLFMYFRTHSLPPLIISAFLLLYCYLLYKRKFILNKVIFSIVIFYSIILLFVSLLDSSPKANIEGYIYVLIVLVPLLLYYFFTAILYRSFIQSSLESKNLNSLLTIHDSNLNEILNTIPYGVLMFDNTYIVNSNISKYTLSILDIPPVGENIFKLLGMDDYNRNILEEAASLYFTGSINFDALAGLLPSSMRHTASSININYFPIERDYILCLLSTGNYMSLDYSVPKSKYDILYKITLYPGIFKSYVTDLYSLIDELITLNVNEFADLYKYRIKYLITISHYFGISETASDLASISNAYDTYIIMNDYDSLYNTILNSINNIRAYLHSLRDSMGSLWDAFINSTPISLAKAKELYKANKLSSVSYNLLSNYKHGLDLDYLVLRINKYFDMIKENANATISCTCSATSTLFSNSFQSIIFDVASIVISNTIKHGLETPHYRIDNNKSPNVNIIVNIRAISNNSVELEIKDDGMGITEKYKDSKFNYNALLKHGFASLPDDRGLVYAYDLVKSIGGSLTIDSVYGSYTVVNATVPFS